LDKTEQGEKFIPSAVEGSPGRSTEKGTPRKRGSVVFVPIKKGRSSSRGPAGEVKEPMAWPWSGSGPASAARSARRRARGVVP
jgi:hypothetical protein